MKKALKEKLVKLIHHCTSCEECRDEDIADRLIANGVVTGDKIKELEEDVAHQRMRADRAETFICMMCAECKWEEHNGTITMQKSCGSLFPFTCGRFNIPIPQPPKGE